MADPRPAGPFSPLVWLLARFRGRISRGVYWLAFMALRMVQLAIINALYSVPESQASVAALLLSLLVVLATVFANVAVAVKRLHDAGYVGAFALALFIPLVDLAFSIWIGIVPGTPGPNRFGPGADRIAP